MEVATIASILMFCAKFWRGLGGLLSDKAAARWGLRGRIWQLWSRERAGSAHSYFFSEELLFENFRKAAEEDATAL